MNFRQILATSACGWACFIFLTWLVAGPSCAQEIGASSTDRVNWRSGADFQKQLGSTTSVQWRDAPLRQRLLHLAAAHRVALFLDRRIDPDQEIDFSVTGVSLEDLLRELAGQLGARTARIGSVVYIGPPRTCGLISYVAPLRRKEIDRWPALARARPEAWSWEELTEPRQLLLDLAQRNRLTVENPEAVPHDLWPAIDLPPLDLADQLTLLLAGFDLTFEIADGGRIRLGPLPADSQYEQAYVPAGPVAEAIAALKRDFPGIAVRREGSRLIVRGGISDHEKIAERLAGPSVRPRTTAGATTHYTMTVENQPAGAVVNTVAKRLGKGLSFAPALQEKLSQKVSFEVKEVSLEALMSKTLDPLGLTYRLTEEAIEVVEKDNNK